MKKLLSMLLVVAMIASMSLVAFAADTNTVSVEIVETDAGIVATFYVTNPSSVSAFTAALTFPSSKVLADKNTSYTLAEDFAGTTVAPGSKTGNVKFAQTFGTSTDRYVTKSGKVAMISFPFTRVDADAELTSADFAYGTSLYVSKITAGTEFTSAKNADNFVAPVYIDDRTKDDPDPEPTVEWDGFTTEETKNWATGFKFVADEEKNTSTSYTGKKVIAFGKNASGDTLTAGSYGIQIGENQYAGQAPVDAGAVFAIILVDSADTKITAESYSYSIYDSTGVVKAGLTATVE